MRSFRQKSQDHINSGGERLLASYLALLEDAYLIAPLTKHSARVARQRAAPPKLVTLSNAMLAVADSRPAPDQARDPQRFGAWVENACLAHAINSGQRVRYWREEPLEVDAVLEGSWGHWAIEIKTGAFSTSDLRGLLELTSRHPQLRPLVLCDEAAVAMAERAGITAISWRHYLLNGLATTQ